MIIAGTLIAMGLTFIGAMMIAEGDNLVTRFFGTIIVMISGAIALLVIVMLGAFSNIIYIDPENPCVQFVRPGNSWECITAEEAG